MQIAKLFFIIITGAALLGGCGGPPPSETTRRAKIRSMEAKYCDRKCGSGDSLADRCYRKCIEDCGVKNPECEFY